MANRRHPNRIGKYTIDSVLGEGAMGVVYGGFDPQIERTVAIKTLHSHLVSDRERTDWLERFAREAKAAGRAVHANLVTVFDYLEVDHQPYLVMEFVDAPTLADLMQSGPMALRQTVRLMDQLLAGVERIHAEGIIHRDIKPENVMVLADGTVKLTDFGVARFSAIAADQSGIIGTPHYMSPEQLRGGDIDPRSDVYACGVLLYELLAGRRPYEDENIHDIFRRTDNDTFPPLSSLVSDLPEVVDGIINLSLAWQPDERFNDIRAFRRVLLRAVGKTLKSSPDEDTTYSLEAAVYSPRLNQSAPNLKSTKLEKSISLSPEFSTAIKPFFSKHIGPIAEKFIERVANESPTMTAFVERLEQELPIDERPAFRQVAAQHGAVPKIADHHDLVDAATEQKLISYLAIDLGPMAKILVRRAVETSSTLDQVADCLVSELNDRKFAKWIYATLGLRGR